MTAEKILHITTEILKFINEDNINKLSLNKKSLELFKDSKDMKCIFISSAITRKSYNSALFLINYYNIYQYEINFDGIEEFKLNPDNLSQLNKLFRINKINKIKYRNDNKGSWLFII